MNESENGQEETIADFQPIGAPLSDAATPFDNPAIPTSVPTSGAHVETAPASWKNNLLPEDAPENVSATLPDSIKIAGVLFIVHGICLAANGFLWGRDHNDNNSILRGLLWFGVTFFVAGGLFERRIWAWWFATLIGGGIGVVNLLANIGSVVSRLLVRGEEQIVVAFVPQLITIAGVVMLISTILLLTPTAKAAFGITKDNPTGLF